MMTNHWIDNVNEIKSIFAGIGLPMSVEDDSNASGDIDTILKLGSISLERSGDISKTSFSISVTISTHKKNWINLLLKLRMITQKLGKDNHYIFTGFEKTLDDTNLIYIGQIIFKGFSDDIILS